jgi:exodeoxyribonuclease VII small subunit
LAKETFEDSFKKLEKIIAKMEGGDLPLEETLKLYEEGMRLYTHCSQKLTEVQKKVELLSQTSEGKLAGKPFPMDEEEEDRDRDKFSD